MSQTTLRNRDRRFYHRADVHLSGETVLLGNVLAGVARFTTVTLDLSSSSAKIHVPEELPLSQLLSLQLYLPDGTDHYCRARVVRSAPVTEGEEEAGTWAAVQFIEPDVWLRTAIAGVIETAGGDST